MARTPARAFSTIVAVAVAFGVCAAHAAGPPQSSQKAGPNPIASASTSSPAIVAVRAASPIRVDGVLDEPAWLSPGTEGFRQQDPDDGAPSTERTIVRFAYDRKNVYVAARLYDSSPAGIAGRLGRRDEQVDSDWFVFGIDPYLDRRSGFFFGVNPSGSIMDGTLYNDEFTDTAWDGIWESAARVDAEGWTVEMRIPFDQLRFRPKDEYAWGVNCQRIVKRKNETTFMAWRPKEESGLVSRFAVLGGIRDIDPGGLNEILPFLAGTGRFRPSQPENPFRAGGTMGADAGFDFKSTLRSDLTLNLTVNPDFGQVEVDPAVINITDQETYYQEKRPFFVEGADIFRFGNGGANQERDLGWDAPAFYYSRRIGRRPQGATPSLAYADTPDWTTILGAAKVTGKLGGGWNVGAMTALTAREAASLAWPPIMTFAPLPEAAEVEPLTGYGVVRALREGNGGANGLGVMATTALRDFKSGDLARTLTGKAFSLAADGWTFLDAGRTWVVTGWLGATRVEGTREAMTRLQTSSMHYFQRPDAPYVRVDPDATSLDGWGGRVFLNKQKGNVIFDASVGALSPGFEAMDLGYHSRGDKVNGHVEAGYRTFHPGRVFRTWSLALQTYRNYDFGGVKFDEYYNLDAKAQFLNYWSVGLFLSYDPNRTSHWLTRGGPRALYVWGFTRRVTVETDDRREAVGKVSFQYRTHPDSYNWNLDLGLEWKPSANFSGSIGPSYSWRHSVGQWVTAVADPFMAATYGTRYVCSDIVQKTVSAEIRLDWTFTPRLSLQAYLQPFLAAGNFFKFKQLSRTDTFDFDVYGENGSTIERDGAGVYTVDPDGSGPAAPFAFLDPDFNLKSLRGTVVLRWEYRPGSVLYAVWTQRREETSHPGDFDPERDFDLLMHAPGDNIFMIKFSYRFGL